MKEFGIILISIGIIGVLISLNLDVSIASGEYGQDRVVNIGLIADRQNYLILSSLISIAGVLLFGFGFIGSNIDEDNGNRIACPFCAEMIIAEAKLCRYCNKNIPEKNVEFEENQLAKNDIDPNSTVYVYCKKCRCMNNENALFCKRCENPLTS